MARSACLEGKSEDTPAVPYLKTDSGLETVTSMPLLNRHCYSKKAFRFRMLCLRRKCRRGKGTEMAMATNRQMKSSQDSNRFGLAGKQPRRRKVLRMRKRLETEMGKS